MKETAAHMWRAPTVLGAGRAALSAAAAVSAGFALLLASVCTLDGAASLAASELASPP